MSRAASFSSVDVSSLGSNPRLFEATHGFHSFSPIAGNPPLNATEVFALDGASANISSYEQAVQARKTNPALFDQFQPLVGRFLSDPRFAIYVQAQLVRNPANLFRYSPLLASLAKGREESIAPTRARRRRGRHQPHSVSQDVQARNANPARFDHQNPFVGRLLSDPRFANYVEAQFEHNPESFFKYSSVLGRLLRGRAEWIALAPTITPPTHVPVPTGPTAVPAPPGLMLLSFGMVSVLGIWRFRAARNAPNLQRA